MNINQAAFLHPWGIDDPNSQTATTTGGWQCYRCGQWITWEQGDHDCPNPDPCTPQFQDIYHDPGSDLRLIIQKLDKIIELLGEQELYGMEGQEKDV